MSHNIHNGKKPFLWTMSSEIVFGSMANALNCVGTWKSLHDPCTFTQLLCQYFTTSFQFFQLEMPFINNYQMALNYLSPINDKAPHTLKYNVRVDHFNWTIGMIVSEFIGRLPFSNYRWTNCELCAIEWVQREEKSHLHLVHMSIQSTISLLQFHGQ